MNIFAGQPKQVCPCVGIHKRMSLLLQFLAYLTHLTWMVCEIGGWWLYNFYDVMVMVMEMDMANQVQILDKAVCLSYNANTLGKGMNPTILPQAMGKLNFLTLIWQPVKEKENSEFKPVKLCYKIAHAEG